MSGEIGHQKAAPSGSTISAAFCAALALCLRSLVATDRPRRGMRSSANANPKSVLDLRL